MSVQVENLEKNMAKLTIEVSADDLEKALQAAYLKEKNKISVPGFRKGKVPRAMIEKMYGPEIFYDDAANRLIPDAYAEAAVSYTHLDVYKRQPQTLYFSNEKAYKYLIFFLIQVLQQIKMDKKY